MNLLMKQKSTHRHREQTCDCQGEVGREGMDWKFGISRWKLLCIEWINNKALLFRNCNQYHVINHDGKEREKKCVLLNNFAEHLHDQLCLTICSPMDCSPPGSSVHGIL